MIPSTNRFRQDQKKDPKWDEFVTPDDSKEKGPGNSKDEPKPGVLKRAAAAVRGRDPVTGYKKAKPAAQKVYGGHGPATSLPRLDRMFGSGDGDEFSDEKTDVGYKSPFAHLGLSGGDEPDQDDDPKVATIRKGLAKAKPKAGNMRFPEADVWDRFSGKGGGPTPKPTTATKKKQQGKLSRFFKGRRDDDI